MADYNINAITRRVVYTGSAGLGPYAFSFEIIDQADVGVYFNQTALTLSSDYTVTINANGTGSVNIITGGNVPSTPTANDTIIIIGARDIERTTDFVTAGDLLASSLNEQLDSNIIFEQQIDERVDRSIKFPVYDSFTGDNVLPAAATRADKILKFDSSGNVTVESASALVGGSVVGANFTNNTFTGDGSQTAFTTTVEAGSKNNAQVYIDGVYQLKSSFSVSGLTLTFTEAPPLNSQIEVIIGNAIDTVDADSGNVNYNQGGTGAQTRTVENKLQEFVSVKDFGATGDGVTNDAPAIQAAFDSQTSGGVVHFPEGTYLCNSKITTTNHVSLIGEGPKSTEIIFASTDGILINRSSTGNRDDSIVIRDMSFLTKTLGTKVGLELIAYESAAPKSAKAAIYNCNFHGFDTPNINTNNYEWGTAIKLNPCDKAVLHDIFIYGKERSSIDNYDTATIGIEIIGSTGVVCYKVDIYRVKTGVRTTGQSEGLNWVDGVIVATDKGLHFDDTVNPSNNHSIRGAHFACEQICIHIKANTDVSPNDISGYHNISNCFFLQRTTEGSRANNATGDGMTNWRAIAATMKNSTIANISMLSNFNGSLTPVTDGNAGIVINAGSANIITNIVGHRVGTTVSSTGGTDNNLINIVTETDAVVSGQYVSVNNASTDIVVSNIDDSVNITKAVKHEFETQGGKAFRILNGATTTVNSLEVFGSNGTDNVLTIRANDDSGSNANQDIKINPIGTGKVRFGTHTATSDTAISGYIEIKDAGGTIRKLAIIS